MHERFDAATEKADTAERNNRESQRLIDMIRDMLANMTESRCGKIKHLPTALMLWQQQKNLSVFV